jgi:hypothetical protein
MIKKFIFIFSLFFSLTVSLLGQGNILFQNYKLDTSYKVLAVSSYNQENNIYYEELSFYIEKLTDIENFKKLVKLGDFEERDTTDENALNIYLLKDKVIIDEIYVNVAYSNIVIDGKKYYFDINQLKPFHNLYPINYNFKWETLKSESQFKISIEKHKLNKKVVAYQDNTFEFGGICSIYINKDKNCDSGPKGIEFIKQKLLDLGFKEKDFLIGYIPKVDESKKFELSLQATKDKYDKLNGPNFKKTKWKSNEFEILTYWRK